jgi:hypothetical protein
MSSVQHQDKKDRTLLDRALELATMGCSLVPCGPDKKAVVDWKPLQLMPSPAEQIILWSQALSPRSWAIVTGPVSGRIVLDGDGAAGAEWLKKWGYCSHVKSGSGGNHTHFTYPGTWVKTMNSKSTKDWPWPGLDVRGNGGYAVTIGQSRYGTYEQLRAFDELESFASLPADFRQVILKPAPQEKNPQPAADYPPFDAHNLSADADMEEALIARALEMVYKGVGRNNSEFWLACQLRDNRYSQSDAYGIALHFASMCPSTNTKGQHEPYTDAEVRATVDSAFSSSVREPWKSRPVNGRPGGWSDFARAGREKASTKQGPNPGPRPPDASSNGCGEWEEPGENETHSTDERAGESDWPNPIPFGRPEPDDFLPGWLPGWLGEMAEATAAATETPLALPSLLSLAVVSACVAGKAVVSPEDGYDEPLNIYTCPAMESGNRKTAVLKYVLNPLFQWEAEQIERTAPERQRLQSLRKSTEARVKALRKQATKAKEPASIETEIEKLEANMPIIPPVPRLLADDITPEALALRMSEQNERMAVLSDEGGIFETLAGRYSKGVPNIDLWLKAHSVSLCRVDRVDSSRPPIILNHPHLTVGISPQPDVIEALRDKPGFRGRGLLARFLYALPKSPLGYRALEPRPIPADIAADYCAGIRQLLDVPLGADIRLRLSPKAYKEWKDFQKALELELRDGGKLDGLRDWGAKLPGACLRLAGIFHTVECGRGFVDASPISHDTIQRALDLGACLISHAQCVFNLMERDPIVEHAETLLAWIVRENQPTFTVRDCFRAHQRRFKRVDALRPVLILLEDHYYIRRERSESSGGRPPSDTCEVNPKVLQMGGNRS